MNAEALQLILNAWAGDGSLGSMARGLYKYTACGMTLGVQKDGEWTYGDYIRNNIGADVSNVSALSVGSIVEGVDSTTETYIVNLDDRPPEVIAQEFEHHIIQVEDEAVAIWKETHGCPTCAQHWNALSLGADDFGQEMEGGDGITPVWDQCPDCGGDGEVI
jgi:hypothetical protein